MSRLNKKFHQLTIEDKKAFIPFIMAGFPNISYSKKLLNKLPGLGADIIEIGMPFTDPMADGPIIQLSSQRALRSGHNTPRTLEMVKKFRRQNKKS